MHAPLRGRARRFQNAQSPWKLKNKSWIRKFGKHLHEGPGRSRGGVWKRWSPAGWCGAGLTIFPTPLDDRAGLGGEGGARTVSAVGPAEFVVQLL